MRSESTKIVYEEERKVKIWRNDHNRKNNLKNTMEKINEVMMKCNKTKTNEVCIIKNVFNTIIIVIINCNIVIFN